MNESLAYKTEKRIYDLLPHEPESIASTLFILMMAIYYLWRMFAISPVYDELYTYYHFISRGPFYSAIHWPLPNNHVAYSVLSSVLDLFLNNFIGLRGVSYACAVSNLILINKICKRYFTHGLALFTVVLYSAMQIVTEYSVLGRGYTLGTTCFLLTVYLAGYICSADDTSINYYRMLAICFILGLYTVPTSIYWIIPMCFAIGAYLLINAHGSRGVREKVTDSIYFRKFISFAIYVLIAAFVTFILYGVIWLAIGCNLLVKTPGSGYTGLSHATVLLRAPVSSLIRGMQYMFSLPYNKGVSFAEFFAGIGDWILRLFAYMLPGMKFLIVLAVAASVIIAVYECVKYLAYSRTLINLIIVSNVLVTLLMLVIMRKLPNLNVFSYSGFVVALCFSTCFQRLINWIIKKDQKYSSVVVYLPLIAAYVLFAVRALSHDYNAQLGERENDVFNTLYIADVNRRHNVAALDCDQQYLLKFGWDIDCTKTDVDGADCVIIDKNLLQPGYTGSDSWKFYQTYETINWDYIDKMRAIYENENFILYIR